jgi:hypothetical protein
MPTVCPMTPRAVVEAQFVTALVRDSVSSDVNKKDVDYSYILLSGGTFLIRQIPIPPLPIIRCY